MGFLKWLISKFGGGPQPVKMHLKARQTAAGIEWDLGKTNPPPNGKEPIIFAKGAPPTDIEIKLVTTQGIQAEFDTEDPIWIAEGTTCPQVRGNACPDQISCITATANLLTLRNMNSRDVTMMYRLNFVGAGVPPCDPEIRNGGKTR